MFRLLATIAAALLAPAAPAQANALQPFGAGPAPAASWTVIGLPNQKKPYTQFELVDLDGQRVLRVDAQEAFGNLVQRARVEPGGGTLAWRWRVDQFPAGADLKRRNGDDTALKVCVFFDLALDQVPADQRRALEFVRKRKPEAPAATICYVWDERLPADSALPNAFTTRMRYIVLESGTASLRQWRSVRRDVAADFLRLYGDETKVVPPVLGVGIGGDSDNTKSRSTAYIADLALVR
jgi:hypothetical protein